MTKPVLVYDVHEKPSLGKWILLAIQHVLAMFGATVLVPMLTGLPVEATLVSAGIGTLAYIAITRGKSPVFLGSSFAFIAPISSALALGGAAEENFGAVMGGLITVGLIYCIIALIIKFLGTEWINKVLPPIVIGPIIMVIGLGLASTAVGMVSLNGGDKSDWRFYLVGGITLFTAILVANYTKGITKLIPVMIGIITGYLSAIVVGLVEFKPVMDAASESALGLFKTPDFAFLKTKPEFSFEVLLLFAPVAIVTISEHIGDHLVLSSIIGRDLTKKPGLHRTILGDGIATMLAGIIGGPANTTYGENTGVIGITKVASVWVIGTAAIIALCLGFVAPFTALIGTIPPAVMGGVSLMLFGIIASSGVRVLINNRIDFTRERNLMIAAVVLVTGIGGLTLTFNSFELKPMAISAILGIILHQILPDRAAGYGEKSDVVKHVMIDGEILD
jgi:uracil permease